MLNTERLMTSVILIGNIENNGFGETMMKSLSVLFLVV